MIAIAAGERAEPRRQEDQRNDPPGVTREMTQYVGRARFCCVVVGVGWLGQEGGAKSPALMAISNANLPPGTPHARQKVNRSADYVKMKRCEVDNPKLT